MLIGITADACPEQFTLKRSYCDLVTRAGAVPVILPACVEGVETYLAHCDGFILSGGDDPDTGQWGIPLHPAARPIDAGRQAFEWALLETLADSRDRPVLGVCLGMQLMALHAGGVLDQHLPDTLATASDHWGRKPHPVSGVLGEGLVHSHHRQAITDAGALQILATAPDGVIEAVGDPARHFYVGVQWHPERTEHEPLGAQLVRDLVAAVRGAPQRRSAVL